MAPIRRRGGRKGSTVAASCERSSVRQSQSDARSEPRTEIAEASDAVKDLIANVDVKGALSQLKEGKFLLKYCTSSFQKPHQRLFWVDIETLVLKWASPRKGPARTQVFLSDVYRIVPGLDSDFWRNKPEAERRLGIELLCHGRNLRIGCAHLREWRTWLRGLLHAHQKAIAKRKRVDSLTNDFIRRQWELSGLDNNGSMSFYELIHLLKRLNCRADVSYAEQLFNQFDEDGSSVLEFEEFKMLIHKLLTHQDLMAIFERYKDQVSQTVTEDGFRRFLLEVQKTPATQLEAEVAEMHTLKEPFRKEEGLTDLGFNLLLTSPFNSIMNPAKRALKKQDMDRPITEYWISSSHNTYLTGDQIIGKSAVGQYIDALLKGCRCVELDCWDGPDGEPIIYHGHTLTSRIPFAAVVRACRDYGFQKSPYPVILSLEMHCSAKQKKRAGEILQECLGDRIYRRKAGAPTPTPHQLRGQFLIKGRVPDESGIEVEEGNEEDIILDEEELRLELLSQFPGDAFCQNFPTAAAIRDSKSSLLGGAQKAPSSDDNEELSSSECTHRSGSNSRHTSRPDDRAILLADSVKESLKVYYDTISLTGRKLQSLAQDHRRSNMDICSMTEKKFLRLSRARPLELARFHQQYFSRVYPSGTRVMSSNFNPMPCWLLGSQMVALNLQALGLATLLNLGRFMENNATGYVLKPSILRNPHCPFDPFAPSVEAMRVAQEIPVEVAIQILAAQQLPRPSTDERGGRKRDAACPYILVSLQGIKQDVITRRTPYVLNNGLNPRWSDQRLVIRWIGLHDSKLREIQWSGLLVHVALRPSRKSNGTLGPIPGHQEANSARLAMKQSFAAEEEEESEFNAVSKSMYTSLVNGGATWPAVKKAEHVPIRATQRAN